MIVDRSIPPHAHPLPVLDDGGRCGSCSAEIASLRGLLATTRSDLKRAVDELRRERIVARVLARDLVEARAAITGPTP